MNAIIEMALSNVLVASALALIVFAISRICHKPAMIHSLWLLVLLKLVTPPIMPIPIQVSLWGPTDSDANRQSSAAISRQTLSHREFQGPHSLEQRKPGALVGKSTSAPLQIEFEPASMSAIFQPTGVARDADLKAASLEAFPLIPTEMSSVVPETTALTSPPLELPFEKEELATIDHGEANAMEANTNSRLAAVDATNPFTVRGVLISLLAI